MHHVHLHVCSWIQISFGPLLRSTTALIYVSPPPPAQPRVRPSPSVPPFGTGCACVRGARPSHDTAHPRSARGALLPRHRRARASQGETRGEGTSFPLLPRRPAPSLSAHHPRQAHSRQVDAIGSLWGPAGCPTQPLGVTGSYRSQERVCRCHPSSTVHRLTVKTVHGWGCPSVVWDGRRQPGIFLVLAAPAPFLRRSSFHSACAALLPPTTTNRQPPTANRQSSPTTDCQPPSAANRRQLPTATNRQPTTADRHEPLTANRQPPPNRRQLPTIVDYCLCDLVSCPCLDHEAPCGSRTADTALACASWQDPDGEWGFIGSRSHSMVHSRFAVLAATRTRPKATCILRHSAGPSSMRGRRIQSIRCIANGGLAMRISTYVRA